MQYLMPPSQEQEPKTPSLPQLLVGMGEELEITMGSQQNPDVNKLRRSLDRNMRKSMM